MESRERVLEAVRQHEPQRDSMPLEDVAEVWRNDRGVVLTAVQRDGRALQFAAEALRADREIVLAAVQNHGSALEYATEALRADREVVLRAVQRDGWALKHAPEHLRADCEVAQAAVRQNGNALGFAAEGLLEDPSFATEAKRDFYLLKLTMLSGRSTVVTATRGFLHSNVEYVLRVCRTWFGLADDGSTMELWHGSDRVPDGSWVWDWPGIQPPGEISEYQLVVRR
eukprot:4799306-Amphidinium_carterae.1